MEEEFSVKKPVTLQDLQKYVKKQNNGKNAQKLFMKLVEEVGELAEMVKKDQRVTKRSKSIKGTMEEEMADVLFYLAALANAQGIDLEESFLTKEKLR